MIFVILLSVILLFLLTVVLLVTVVLIRLEGVTHISNFDFLLLQDSTVPPYSIIQILERFYASMRHKCIKRI